MKREVMLLLNAALLLISVAFLAATPAYSEGRAPVDTYHCQSARSLADFLALLNANIIEARPDNTLVANVKTKLFFYRFDEDSGLWCFVPEDEIIDG